MKVIKSINDLDEAISLLLEYNWKDEEEDYAENPDESHIFCTMVALDNFIHCQEETPESFVLDNLGRDMQGEEEGDEG